MTKLYYMTLLLRYNAVKIRINILKYTPFTVYEYLNYKQTVCMNEWEQLRIYIEYYTPTNALIAYHILV
jgi:hypothetical protein